MKKFWKQGEQYVWATGVALAVTLLMLFMLLFVVMKNGLGVFWPTQVVELKMKNGTVLLGEITHENTDPKTGAKTIQLKTANRELDSQQMDFRWIKNDDISQSSMPSNVYVLERMENGNFIGYLKEIKPDKGAGANLHEKFVTVLTSHKKQSEERLAHYRDKSTALSAELQSIRSKILKIKYQIKSTKAGVSLSTLNERLSVLVLQETQVKAENDALNREQSKIEAEIKKNTAVFLTASGGTKEIPIVDIVRASQPNQMSFADKCGHFWSKSWELIWEKPRESNTEGGLFPAIFGTVLLVLLTSLSAFPLGVIAGIYLREYARDGWLVRLVRIAVNNLAGIPSIVYGIFGLVFFIYGIGGAIDTWFFPERTAENISTFGTGGILWASLTLGLLTVPVVIVSTEEALGAIPMGVREGSLALGATKFQTLKRVLMPMASPGIMTGFILAMARAAGEVAPLMITGVVKMAPSLPIDGQFPFVHLDGKFMHLGYHIFDVAFQSPNVEASKPMVFVTTLLLLLVVVIMNSVAIWLRNKMRRRYYMKSI